MRTLIIIPAYNEEEAIQKTLRSLLSLPDCDVVVINDGSLDRTAEQVTQHIAAHPEHAVRLVNLPLNVGIGGAMQTGFKYAERAGYDYGIQFDGDGQHSAESLNALLSHAEEHGLDLCIGSRFLSDDANFRSSPLRRVGIRFFSILIGFLTRIRATDPTSGFRVYGRRSLALFARVYPDDYPEPEVLLVCSRNDLKVGEFPVQMQERQGGVSSIRYWNTAYYMMKVTIAILIDRIRAKELS